MNTCKKQGDFATTPIADTNTGGSFAVFETQLRKLVPLANLRLRSSLPYTFNSSFTRVAFRYSHNSRLNGAGGEETIIEPVIIHFESPYPSKCFAYGLHRYTIRSLYVCQVEICHRSVIRLLRIRIGRNFSRRTETIIMGSKKLIVRPLKVLFAKSITVCHEGFEMHCA